MDFFLNGFSRHVQAIKDLIARWFSELLRRKKYSNTTIRIDIIKISLGYDRLEWPKDNS
ncbi:hypothetical protein ACJMK2_044397, partial [Sinanodonta woodiana]